MLIRQICQSHEECHFLRATTPTNADPVNYSIFVPLITAKFCNHPFQLIHIVTSCLVMEFTMQVFFMAAHAHADICLTMQA